MQDEMGLSCRYCRRSEDEVLALLAFPDDLNICEECVWMLVELVAADYPEWRKQAIAKMMVIRTDAHSPKKR